MYPQISDLIYSLFGVSMNIQIPTYSFFLILTFLAGGFTLYLELKRKAKEGLIQTQIKKVLVGKPIGVLEMISIGLKSFLVGYKIIGMAIFYSFSEGNPAHYIFSLKGSWWGGFLFAVLFIFLGWYTKRKEKLEEPVWIEQEFHPHHLTANIFVIAVVFGIIGAKIFNLFEDMETLRSDPWGSIFSLGGLSFHGGFVLATIVLVVYVNQKKIGWINFTDAASPGMLLGYAIARIGCQLEGDGCWGIDNLQPKPEWLGFLPDWMWAFNFPHNGLRHGIPMDNCSGTFCFELQNPVFPTSFYEMTICFILFAILWSLRKKIIIPGLMFSIYLIINGTERVFMELIRINRHYTAFGIQYSQAQVVSVILILLGITGILYFRHRHKKSALSLKVENSPND